MPTLTVTPSSLKGTLSLPSSKSQTLRAVLFAALARGESRITNPLNSPDTEAMCTACRSLGASISRTKDGSLVIQGINGKVVGADNVLDAGNSGIVLRFVGALAALGSQPIILTGDASLRNNRPISELLRALTSLGVRAESTRGNGYAPFIVQGPLKGGVATLNGADSQPVSALLIAAGLSTSSYEFYVKDPGEKPWIDLTLSWLKKLGIPCTHQDYLHYKIEGKGAPAPFTYRVPSDLSSCAFPVAAALTTGSTLTLEGIDWEDLQGDKKLFTQLQEWGAALTMDPKDRTLCVDGSKVFQGGNLDINDCIDALPILSVLACYATTPTHLYNGAIARKKECDRIHAIATELSKMGAKIEEKEDGLLIHPSKLKGATLHSHHDHRLAMSLAVAALGAHGPSTISNTACIAKTYPSFVEDFISVGAKL
jgi:3-phosphoshikimate 1-carboxyvinyltransferase